MNDFKILTKKQIVMLEALRNIRKETNDKYADAEYMAKSKTVSENKYLFADNITLSINRSLGKLKDWGLVDTVWDRSCGGDRYHKITYNGIEWLDSDRRLWNEELLKGRELLKTIDEKISELKDLRHNFILEVDAMFNNYSDSKSGLRALDKAEKEVAATVDVISGKQVNIINVVKG